MKKQITNEKQTGSPSISDCLESIRSCHMGTDWNSRVGEISDMMLHMDYEDLRLLNVISMSALDIREYLNSIQEKQALEEGSSHNVEEKSDNEGSIENGFAVKSMPYVNTVTLTSGIYVVPEGAEYLFDENETGESLIIVH